MTTLQLLLALALCVAVSASAAPPPSNPNLVPGIPAPCQSGERP